MMGQSLSNEKDFPILNRNSNGNQMEDDIVSNERDDCVLDDTESDGKLNTKNCDPPDKPNPIQTEDLANNDVEEDGKLYTKIRDPPGQKCIYILPGDTTKETYRLSTFEKFPTECPVNPCNLAKYGFYFTGYKDRVKCFSCGSTVHDWKENDQLNDRRWHLCGCSLALGKDESNKRIKLNTLDFVGKFITELKILDSGYDSTSNETKVHSQQTTSVSSDHTPSSRSGANTSPRGRSSAVKSVQNLNQTSSTLTQVTFEEPSTSNKASQVEGLKLAPITSTCHRELLKRKLNLHKEKDRRKSFCCWNLSYAFVIPKTLAASGFFYLGNSDRVQCFSCSGILRNWNTNDSVEEQHAIHFPHCRMVLKNESRNIPLPETVQKLQNSKKNIQEPADPNPQEMENLKLQFPCLYPVNPHMKEFNARLQTFDQRWPSQKVNATPQHIAKAGFFFLGERDRAKCWYCNGGLQNWEPNDEPFTDHAKWFPGCEFLLQCKGVEFVKQIVVKFPNLRRPALRNPRFDHKTLKLIPMDPISNQQQPAVVDPQTDKNNEEISAGLSPTSSTSRNHANEPTHLEFHQSSVKEKAFLMGFDLPTIERAVQRRSEKTGRDFVSFEELINELQCETTKSTNASKLELERNLLQLENERKCKYCLERLAEYLLLPCGHLGPCKTCVDSCKHCAICKRRVSEMVKVHTKTWM